MMTKSQRQEFTKNLTQVISSPDFKAALKKAEKVFQNIVLKIQSNDFDELDNDQAHEISKVYDLKKDLNFMPFYVLNMRIKELKKDLGLRASYIESMTRLNRDKAHTISILLKELADAKAQIQAKDTALKHAIDKDLFSNKKFDETQADLDLYGAALNHPGSLLWAVEIAPEPGADFEQFPAESKQIAQQAVDRYRYMNRLEFEGYTATINAVNDCIRVNVWAGSKAQHAKDMLYTIDSLKDRAHISKQLLKLKSYFR